MWGQRCRLAAGVLVLGSLVIGAQTASINSNSGGNTANTPAESNSNSGGSSGACSGGADVVNHRGRHGLGAESSMAAWAMLHTLCWSMPLSCAGGSSWPTITSISPTGVSFDGGLITVTGTGFEAGTTCVFPQRPAPFYPVMNCP